MLTAFKELICLLQPAYQSLKVFLTVHDRSIVEGIEYGIQPALKPQTPIQCDAYYSKGNRFPESSTSASFVLMRTPCQDSRRAVRWDQLRLVHHTYAIVHRTGMYVRTYMRTSQKLI